MAAPPIQGAKQVKDWLEWRNPRDALIIGARVALRVLPLVARAAPIVEHQQAKRRFAALALATFRATALARAAGKYRSRAFRTSLFADAASAADNAGAAFAAADANGAPFVAAAASAVRAAVAHPAASAADAAAAAAAAVVADASAVWASVADDIAVLQSMGTAPLAPSPLWAALLPPLWATGAWASLRAALPADQNWTFWIDWYESILLARSRPQGPRRSRSGNRVAAERRLETGPGVGQRSDRRAD